MSTETIAPASPEQRHTDMGATFDQVSRMAGKLVIGAQEAVANQSGSNLRVTRVGNNTTLELPPLPETGRAAGKGPTITLIDDKHTKNVILDDGEGGGGVGNKDWRTVVHITSNGTGGSNTYGKPEKVASSWKDAEPVKVTRKEAAKQLWYASRQVAKARAARKAKHHNDFS